MDLLDLDPRLHLQSLDLTSASSQQPLFYAIILQKY